MFRFSRYSMCCALMTALLVGGGEDDGLERVVVSGAVKYQGKPIPVGMIRFVPPPTSAAPASGSQIIDGRYSANIRGGVPVGTYKVNIEAYSTVTNTTPPSKSAPPGLPVVNKQYLPAKYNANTTLEITIQPGSGEITKDFDLAE